MSETSYFIDKVKVPNLENFGSAGKAIWSMYPNTGTRIQLLNSSKFPVKEEWNFLGS